MPNLIPIDQVARMLSERAEALARELLPHGQRHGPEWTCGSLAGEQGTSLSVRLTGARAGVWKDFASSEAGDAMDLVAAVLFRGDKKQALQWSKRWLGLDEADPAQMAIRRRELAERAERDTAADAAETADRRRRARGLWLSATPAIEGTPVEYYLAGRGIDLAQLRAVPGSLGALRYGSRTWCEEAGRSIPAMLAAIGAPGLGWLACHRTYLEQAGPRDWRKARLTTAKKVLAPYAGGCISLWRGKSGRSLTKALAGEIIDVTEGIEDALTVAMAAPECRVVAAVSLSNLRNIVLPPGVGELRVWRDNDTKPAAVAAFDGALSALLARGIAVSVVSMPQGVKDVNELWQKEG